MTNTPPATIHLGDCIEVMRTLPENSVDAIVTDPPYGLGFMGKAWDELPPGEEWARECLRVLKPGGHLLAFGGSRTWHRLAVAVEDAGFEVRDSIAWLYGSGFPKSLDVSKAIDKAANSAPLWDEIRSHIRLWRDSAGMTNSELNAALGLRTTGCGMAAHWTRTGPNQQAIPSKEMWQRLKAVLAWPDCHLDATYDAVKDGADRPVVGVKPNALSGWSADGNSRFVDRDITAPATDDARKWAGFGTALKPAFEPIVVARKPLAAPSVNVLAMVESELRERLQIKEIRWTSGPASGAVKRGQQTSSSSTEAQPAVATSAAPADASGTPSARRPTVSGSELNTAHGPTPTVSPSEPSPVRLTSDSETTCSTPTAASVNAAASDSISSSPSTTLTEVAAPTARPSTARSMGNSDARDTHPAIESFAGIATGLTGSRATVRIERLPDGSFIWPGGLPESVPGGPLTVAANVLAHGTGALNIDGCRVGTSDVVQASASKGAPFGAGGYVAGEGRRPSVSAGRWPANVVLDESQAAALDQMSGTSSSGRPSPSARYGLHEDTGANAVLGRGLSSSTPNVAPYGDSGGASRFFYVAKAPTRERPKVDGVAHPTVKPLALMRWLVRLVTPPGGTVLEPFAGSGTTVEACALEGFACIAIEREPDYLPLIQARLARVEAAQPDPAGPALFDMEETA